jgi:acyl-CoA dehydrogenase
MTIEFRTPDEIEKQLRQVQIVAENVMRPESRVLDDNEHSRPHNFVHMMWPQMREMERANLDASLRRSRNGNGDSGEKLKSDGPKKPRTANLSLVHMIEMLSWGDAGVYLCIPASQAVGTPDQKERFLRRFTEGEPKWGAMAMTEPQAGSDTSNIQTTAVFDPAANEWILNGQKIFCTSGQLAYAESDGLIVVWATVDKDAGRAGMKPFVVEAGTPGLKIVKVEEKLGIRASDTASFVLDNCRVPADNLLGDSQVKSGGFKGAMRTFDATRPIVAASAIGIGRAAFEFARDTLAKQGVRMDYESPRWKLTTAQADMLDMEIQLRQAWLLTLKATALLDSGGDNKLTASMCKVKAGKAVTVVTQKAVELLGPLGYTTQTLAEKWMRDAKINDIYEGTGQINTLIVAREILGYTRAELK